MNRCVPLTLGVLLLLPVFALCQDNSGASITPQVAPPPFPPPKKVAPVVLMAGTFRIVVEQLDRPSTSIDPSLPSGIGRIRFTCMPVVFPFPWPGLHQTVRQFAVVAKETNPLAQISIEDALLVDPEVQLGGTIRLTLPVRTSTKQISADKELLLNLLRGPHGLPGIRVHFHDVKWNGPVAPVVVLTGGVATYPTTPAIPHVPALLRIEPGFKLGIDSLVITPARAEVRGSVLLPDCMVSATSCTQSSLPLPWTPITATCELYREVPDSAFGPLYVGETGIQILGRGYTIDFSSVRSNTTVTPPLANNWKGVVLSRGDTPNPPRDTMISNRGYVKAKYNFTNGLITTSGLEARLNLAAPFVFETLEPIGYYVRLRPPDGFITLSACCVSGGQFRGDSIRLPLAAIRDEVGNPLQASYDTLTVQSDMDLFGGVKVQGGFAWGEFSKTVPPQKFYSLGPDIMGPFASGYFYLAARQVPPYYPTASGAFVQPFIDTPEVRLETLGMQGITLTQLGHRKFTIWTQDIPKGTIFHPNILSFADSSIFVRWMNIIGTGIHTEIRVAKYIAQPDEVDLGPTWSTNPRYLGESPLRVSFKSDPQEKQRQMVMQFVESATWYSNFDGRLFLDGPINDTTRFSELVFTSTANAGGAHLDLTHTMDMKYWDVTTIPRDSTQSGGVVCVKLGVIYLTAAGIFEPRHFARPFWLTWGEIKASGNLGQLFFDYNGGGQCFDQIPYAPSLVQLSSYNPATPNDSGYVITYGNLAFSFFGAKPLWVYDWKSPIRTGPPWSGRTARTPLTSPYGSGVSDLHLVRDWGNGVANLDFTVDYDSLNQEGFIGPGKATITHFVVFDHSLPGYIDVKAGRSCFTLNHDADVGFNLGPLLTSSALKKVWGCGCIVGDNLERVAVGGELTANAGAGFSIVARTGGATSMVLGYSPSQTDMLFAGDLFAVIVTRNIEIMGYMTVTINRDVGYAEGYLKGVASMDGLVGGVSGEGEFQWHFGTDNETIQGRVAVMMYHEGLVASTSSQHEGGLWVGINTNKDDVWIMDGISGRYGLNKHALPQNISGFYAYTSWSRSGNALYVIAQGGYQTYAGLGAFLGFGGDIGGGFGVIGNVGLHVWGEILGGIVSVDAWGNLQIIVGVPPAFEGAIGYDVCALWVACVSGTIHAGFNANQGFYLY